ncbi:MAG: DNA repair protein RecO [Selenomonadaceae bacterium]|nr:DNA repair protein RecO [Selenomonadaceae bacterium]
MAKYQTKALVIGALSWGDTDKLLTLYTLERGKVRCTAFGCRRPKNPLAAACQMFREIEAELTEGAKLDTLRGASILGYYRKFDQDFTAMAYASFVAELVGELFPEGEADSVVYENLKAIFSALEVRNPRVTALAAAWQLISQAGWDISLAHCVRCGKAVTGEAFWRADGALCESCASEGAVPLTASLKELIANLKNIDWHSPPTFTLRKTDLITAEKILLGYLPQVLGKQLKSLQFIQQL